MSLALIRTSLATSFAATCPTQAPTTMARCSLDSERSREGFAECSKRDALTRFTQPLTSSYYFVRSVESCGACGKPTQGLSGSPFPGRAERSIGDRRLIRFPWTAFHGRNPCCLRGGAWRPAASLLRVGRSSLENQKVSYNLRILTADHGKGFEGSKVAGILTRRPRSSYTFCAGVHIRKAAGVDRREPLRGTRAAPGRAV